MTKLDIQDRNQIITDLYGAPDLHLRDIFDRKLGVTERAQGFIKEARNMRTERSVAWLQKVLILEQQARHSPLTEDLVVDYLEEKKH